MTVGRSTPVRLLKRVIRPIVERMGIAAALSYPRARGCALTFDDGPHPDYTPRLLDILARHDTRATFFVVGRQAERHPQIIQRMVAEGHVVGNHTFDHCSCLLVSSSELARQIDRTAAVLRPLLGNRPRYFRPPFGHFDIKSSSVVRAKGYRTVTWSIQSDDHLLIPHERIAANVMGALAPGGIILMHDRLGHTDSNDKLDRTATLMAVDAILTQARPLMSFQTLPELEASATPAFDFQPLLASSKARAELRILLARYYPAP